MKKILLLFVCTSTILSAQTKPAPENKKGTVKIQKNTTVTEIVFDSLNYRLIGLDESKTVYDTCVISFDMSYTVNGAMYIYSAKGPFLTLEMRQNYDKYAKTKNIWFDNIKARNTNHSIRIMPALILSPPKPTRPAGGKAKK